MSCPEHLLDDGFEPGTVIISAADGRVVHADVLAGGPAPEQPNPAKPKPKPQGVSKSQGKAKKPKRKPRR
jgi:hypothetical protein